MGENCVGLCHIKFNIGLTVEKLSTKILNGKLWHVCKHHRTLSFQYWLHNWQKLKQIQSLKVRNKLVWSLLVCWLSCVLCKIPWIENEVPFQKQMFMLIESAFWTIHSDLVHSWSEVSEYTKAEKQISWCGCLSCFLNITQLLLTHSAGLILFLIWESEARIVQFSKVLCTRILCWL